MMVVVMMMMVVAVMAVVAMTPHGAMDSPSSTHR